MNAIVPPEVPRDNLGWHRVNHVPPTGLVANLPARLTPFEHSRCVGWPRRL